MKRLTLFALMLLLFPAVNIQAEAGARRKVVLLTSLDMSAVKLPFYLFFMGPHYREYESKLERAFRAFYESRGFEVEVKHDSNQADLWDALHSPASLGVFWVSHSAAFTTVGEGLGSGSEITDLDGFDITPAFQEVHPNVKFLGVVGCKSSGAIQKQLERNQVFKMNPTLRVEAFDQKVDGQRGLNQLMRLSETSLRSAGAGSFAPGTQGRTCPTRRGFPLELTRYIPNSGKYVPAMRVEANHKVLGVFSSMGFAKGEVWETITVHLDIEAGAVKPLKLKLVSHAGENPSATVEDLEIGKLEMSEPWTGAAWTRFVDERGQAVGVTTDIYRYSGVGSIDQEPVDYQPFHCDPTP